MQSIKSKGVQALLAATVTAMIVMPIAIAGADGSATSSATKTARQIKALKKQSANLAKLAAELARKVAALEGAKAPTSLPPSGAAGGDLTGAYPAPQLGPNSVGALEIVNESVRSSDIADDTIGSLDIANNSVSTDDIAQGTIRSGDLAAESVGGGSFKGAIFRQTEIGVKIMPGETKQASAFCPDGSRLIGGGFEWVPATVNGASIMSSGPSFLDPNSTWSVQGRVDTGVGGRETTLLAAALCLVT